MFNRLIYNMIFYYNNRYAVIIKIINQTIKVILVKILDINNQSVIIAKIIMSAIVVMPP